MMVHVPPELNVTTPLEIEQTEELAAAMVKETARLLLAVAVGVYVAAARGFVGAVDVNEIVWLPLATVNDCVAWVAAFQSVLPAWLAFRMQVPAPTKDTVPLEIVQTLVVADVIVTVRPELAVAVAE